MRKNRVQAVEVHPLPAPEGPGRADGIDEIYARYIRRRLSEEGLMPQQKVEVLDCLLTYLRSPSGARLPGSTDE